MSSGVAKVVSGLLVLGAVGCVRAVPAPEPASAASKPAQLFDLRSDFWVNLHQELFAEAYPPRRLQQQGDPSASPAPEGPPEWRDAVSFYRSHYGPRDLMTPHMATINWELSELGDAPAVRAPPLPAELVPVLTSAAKVYRERWPQQDAANRAWVRELEPLLQRHGQAMAEELTRLLRTPWPSQPIRVDVAKEAGFVGAYTMLGPAHITVSSADPAYRGEAALEMVFHETSHALIEPLIQALEAECQVLQKDPKDAWHMVLFYTAGYVARRHLGEAYVPYADKNGLWARRLPAIKPILERHWQPYLDGKAGFEESVKAIAAELP